MFSHVVLNENPIVQRIWYEIKNNIQRWDLCWEWLAPEEDGEYVRYEDVLKIVEKYLEEVNKGGN